MCGRFYVEEEDNEEILRIIRNLDKRFQGEKAIKTGEVFPTNTAAVLTAEGDSCVPAAMTWGFPGFKNSEVLINARSETAKEKAMFSEPLLTKRIVIPATGFFEWSHKGNKDKFLFKDPQEKSLYMGGFYQMFPDGARFIILTTKANASMQEIHDRMPVIIQKSNIDAFLFNYNDAATLLKEVPGPLIKEKVSPPKEYEQLTLF